MERLVILVTSLILLATTNAFGQLFSLPTNYAAGNSPNGIFASDLNGDGHIDLAVTNNGPYSVGGDTISIFINNGNGTFQPAVYYWGGGDPNKIFISDFDIDGDNDLAVSSEGYNYLSILNNNGDGTFQPPEISFLEGVFAVADIFGADLDDNGRKDIVLVDYNLISQLSVLTNWGEFYPPVQYCLHYYSQPYSVFAVDLDNDSDKDLAAVQLGYPQALIPGMVSILLNNGYGHYSLTNEYNIGLLSNTNSVFAGDLNNDTYNDLAVANMGYYNVSVIINNGNGTFQPEVNYGTGGTPTDVFISDLDCDGDRDLAIANEIIGSDITVFLNYGNATFQSAMHFETGNEPRSLFAADLDGDGDKDLAVANPIDDNISIMFNNTNPLLGGISGIITNDNGSIPLENAYVKIFTIDDFCDRLEIVADTTNFDGLYGALNLVPGRYGLEVSRNGYYTNTFYVIVPEGETITANFSIQLAGFIHSADYASGDGPNSICAADFDGDGSKDLAATNSGSDNISVFINNRYGIFQEAVNYGTGDEPIAIIASDFNGDNEEDLAVVNYYSYNVSIFENSGGGIFQSPVNYAVGSHPMSGAAADLDGDGDIDLVAANSYANNVSILSNNGDGTFQSAVNFAVGSFPMSICVVNLDTDNDNDLAVVNGATNNVSILKNNGDGTFQAAINYAVGNVPVSVSASDLDNDGDNDLAVANSSANNISILKNNGNGTFPSAVNYPGGETPVFVCAFDVDADGFNDLAAASTGNWVTDSIAILFNNGNATFRNPINYVVGDSPGSISPADLDSDGDIDMAAALVGSDSISIMLNQSNAGPPLCLYFTGDINGDDLTNGIDVVYGVTYFKGGNNPPVDCSFPEGPCPQGTPFYAAGDVNGTCDFNGIDITYFVAYLKGNSPALYFCIDCPPGLGMLAIKSDEGNKSDKIISKPMREVNSIVPSLNPVLMPGLKRNLSD